MHTPGDIIKIWKMYQQNLDKYVRSRIRNPDDVDDILQNIFIKIQNGIAKLESDKKIHSWILAIARNTVIDYYRSQKNGYVSSEMLPDSVDERETGAEEEIARGLLPMVAKLPTIYREAIILSQYRSMSNREIANKLNISVSGIKSRVQRGRSLLKEMLLDCCKFELDANRRIVDYEPNE